MAEVGRTCPVCGARGALHWSDEPLHEEFDDGDVAVVEGFRYERCAACGETLVRGADLDELQRRTVTVARTDLERLSSEEIREARFALGLTQSELESQLGVSAGTVGRWERGEVLQGATADRLMRLIRHHPELLPELGFVARERRGPYRTRPSE
ncbi:MAG: type II toxin-antitoxin system MqsA family antitoxin [Coriobacteriia bacterium]|nr:type II toxin-antitoxin system MqsA family antitoxin [Coriobacteriia bacterium]